jgi:hypothetical protein
LGFPIIIKDRVAWFSFLGKERFETFFSMPGGSSSYIIRKRILGEIDTLIQLFTKLALPISQFYMSFAVHREQTQKLADDMIGIQETTSRTTLPAEHTWGFSLSFSTVVSSFFLHSVLPSLFLSRLPIMQRKLKKFPK